MPDQQVNFAITKGVGTLSDTTAFTDSLGRASVSLTSGTQFGEIQIEAQLPEGGSMVVFTASVVPPSFDGDFLPLAAGYRWDFSGDSSGRFDLHMHGTIDGQRIDDRSSEPASFAVTESREIEPSRTISLPSGRYELFGERSITNIDGDITVTTRFLEKTGNAVLIRAVEDDLGQTLEVEDPTFIPTPLTVGDTWESFPQLDPDELANSIEGVTDVTVTMHSQTTVVGRRNVIVMGETVDALQLNQVLEMEGTIFTADLSLDMSVEARVTLYLKENSCRRQFQRAPFKWQIRDLRRLRSPADMGASMKFSWL